VASIPACQRKMVWNLEKRSNRNIGLKEGQEGKVGRRVGLPLREGKSPYDLDREKTGKTKGKGGGRYYKNEGRGGHTKAMGVTG